VAQRFVNSVLPVSMQVKLGPQSAPLALLGLSQNHLATQSAALAHQGVTPVTAEQPHALRAQLVKVPHPLAPRSVSCVLQAK